MVSFFKHFEGVLPLSSGFPIMFKEVVSLVWHLFTGDLSSVSGCFWDPLFDFGVFWFHYNVSLWDFLIIRFAYNLFLLSILKMQINYKLDFRGNVYENGCNSYKNSYTSMLLWQKCSTSLFCQLLIYKCIFSLLEVDLFIWSELLKTWLLTYFVHICTSPSLPTFVLQFSQ